MASEMTACAERIVDLTRAFTSVLDTDGALRAGECRIAEERRAAQTRGDGALARVKDAVLAGIAEERRAVQRRGDAVLVALEAEWRRIAERLGFTL